MRHDVIAMENYVAADQRPLDKCLEDVIGCDLYIGLFAWRYGYVPLEDNPEQKSITELEYRTAVKHGKPALLFLLDDNALWSPKWMDSQTGDGNAGALILALRQEFLRDKLVSTFQGKEDIASVVLHAVHDWEKRHHLSTATDPFVYMRTKYLEQVYRRYSSVKLPIGSPQGLSLHAIFQPLTLRRDPLVVENLARDKRRALLGETSEDYEHKQGDDGQGNLYPSGDLYPSPELYPGVQREITAQNAVDALKKSHQQRMVVLGGPGTGKTTTLKYLTARQAKEALENPEIPVPIYLSLAALARSGKSLQRYLLDIVEDMEVDPAYADLLWHNMQGGQAYVCLDSLDEVDPKMRSDMIDLVNRKAQEPGNIWIVGSRFTEYKGGQFKAGQFSEWELQPMSASLRKELASRLFPELCVCLELTHQEPPTAEKFVSLLEQHPRASAWGENPLLLSLAAVVYLQNGSLPASRILLYQRVIEAVLATREPDPIRQKILQRMLTELALWVHQQRGRTFTTEDLITFFMEEQHRSWGETNDLTHAVINSGIVEIVARQTYGFRHQTFQEYLTASELARRLAGTDVQLREQAEAFIWSKRTYSRWTEVLRMMVGILVQNHGASGLRKASQWIEKLAQRRTSEEGDPGFLSFSLALIAVSELGEIPEWHSLQTVNLEIALLETWFDELMLAVQRGQDPKERRLTSLTSEIKHFQEPSIDSIFEKIVASLRHKFRPVRETCVDLLGMLGSRSVVILLRLLLDSTFCGMFVDPYKVFDYLKELKSYVPVELLITALQDEDSYVRWVAVEVLGKLGERAPTGPLTTALQDGDSYVRRAAAEALGELEERAPIEPLIAALQDEDLDVWRAAARVLGKLGERVPIEPLIAALGDKNNKDPKVRTAVVEALGGQGERAPIEPLIAALGDKDSRVRQTAAEALGELGERAPIEPLIAALGDKASRVQRAAMEALGKLRKRTPIEPLIAALQDENSEVSRIAIEELNRQKLQNINDILLGVLQDENSETWKVTVNELKKQKTQNMPNDLLKAELQSIDSKIILTASEYLGEMKVKVPIEYFIAKLYNVDKKSKVSIIKALGEIEEQAPIESLIAALQDENSEVRRVAIYALGERIPSNLLMVALQDRNSKVRFSAIEAVIGLGEQIPLELLIAALQDEHPDVRLAAAWALGELGEQVPIEPLIAMFQDRDSDVWRVAAEVLGKLGVRAPVELLIAALQDEDADVRQVAAGSLRKMGERAPVELLIAALQDENSDVRWLAVEALGEQGERVPVEPLLAALQDRHENVRHAAAETLAKLGERVPIDLLLTILQDKDSYMRQMAAEALGKLGTRVPVEPMLTALQDEDSGVRQAVAEALGKLRKHVPVEPLIAALQDENSGVRWAAVTALGNLGDCVPLDPLLETLQDGDSSIRRIAIRIVQKRDSQALQSLLQEALDLLQGNPPGPIFRSIANSFFADTLGNIGSASPAMLDQLTELLQWPYWQVRMKAAQALGKIRRNIPDEAIRRLLVLQRDTNPRNRAVQKAADDALAEILSLETGIEDD